MHVMAQTVTVTIPTLCSAERERGLVRAIESLRAQSAGIPCIRLVANGPRVDRELAARLARDYGVDVCCLADASLPRAIAAGRRAVETPYFGFLDDDDEYLPDALAIRLHALAHHPEAAAAVTDGLYAERGREEPRGVATVEAGRDPLRALLRQNWLASCGGLFRSDMLGADFFDDVTAYFEWTYVAFKVASRFPVAIVPRPGYRIHSEPGSLSKSPAYRNAEPAALGAIADLDLPRDVRHALLSRRGDAFHSLSSYHLRRGERGPAWRAHAASLLHPGGARYLTYTFRVLLGARAADGP